MYESSLLTAKNVSIFPIFLELLFLLYISLEIYPKVIYSVVQIGYVSLQQNKYIYEAILY